LITENIVNYFIQGWRLIIRVVKDKDIGHLFPKLVILFLVPNNKLHSKLQYCINLLIFVLSSFLT